MNYNTCISPEETRIALVKFLFPLKRVSTTLSISVFITEFINPVRVYVYVYTDYNIHTNSRDYIYYSVHKDVYVYS